VATVLKGLGVEAQRGLSPAAHTVGALWVQACSPSVRTPRALSSCPNIHRQQLTSQKRVSSGAGASQARTPWDLTPPEHCTLGLVSWH
jgi:hypothetical protein